MLCMYHIIIDILADNDYLPIAWLLVQLWMITTQVFLPLSLFVFFEMQKSLTNYRANYKRGRKYIEGNCVETTSSLYSFCSHVHITKCLL